APGRQRLQDNGAPPPLSSEYCFTAAALEGSPLALRAEVFREINGFDPRFATFTVASADLQYRLIIANYRLGVLVLRRRAASADSALNLSADRTRFARKYRRRLAGLNHDGDLFSRHLYPELSVAIATRNYGRWLPRCLDSILLSAKIARVRLQIVVT